MLLKKLEIHNIASIADAVIDFTDSVLGNSSIFLISGETGAGKTTILDAICLALYDKTPRMTSVAKEDIGLLGDGDEKYYSNDNSQFLRRGTGEGWIKLTFEANDNKDYEAAWSIQRNYKKPDKRLQKPSRSLSALDGTYGETNKRIIPDKINELIGLDYEQFCRTVMLAQGEFTKFLKSDKSEKSGILEKLTGTAIYSEIGKRIASSYLEKKNKWETLKHEISNITVFTDEEKAERYITIENLTKESDLLSNEKGNLEKKFKWISDMKNLSGLKKTADERVIKLQSIIASDSFIEEECLIRDYKLTAEARLLALDKKNLENSLVDKDLEYPNLELKLNNSLKIIELKKNEIEEVKSKVNELGKEADSYDISKINNQLQELNDREKSLTELDASIGNLQMAIDSRTDYENEIKLKVQNITDSKSKIESLQSPISLLQKQLRDISGDLEKIELATSKGVKAIRESLIKGDHCPVCGTIIEEELDNNLFSEMLQPIRDRKKTTEKDLLDLQAQKVAAEKIIADSSKIESELKVKLSKQSDLIIKIQKQVALLIAKCGFSDIQGKDLSIGIKSAKEETKSQINVLRSRLKEADKIQKELKNLRDSFDKLTKELEAANELTFKAKIAIEKWNTEKKNLLSNLKIVTDKIHTFLNENTNISVSRLNELSLLKKESVHKIEENHKVIHDNLSKESGAAASLEEQMSRLKTVKPDLKDDENCESLKNTLLSVTESINLKQREIGQIKEQLSNDSVARKKFEQKILEEEREREEKEKWEGLYRLLGDNEGFKFRNVAQSFILRSLLDNANAYMKSFTDRYTLTCNPGSLAILVKDCYRPSEPQPASILSGGESFMASLSLALALSNLKAGDSSVDILFIDEGFGTLSPEYLNNVMHTLEKLHQIGGRKVGLISHVAEMKERIPVQIQVNRESPALSHVTVVNMG